MAYNKLRFYDSDSNELNLVQSNGVWTGTAYLPLVSTGLYETLTLHLLEEVRGEFGNVRYIKPIAETPGDVEFEFEFELNYGDSEDIYLYSAQAEAGDLYVQVDKIQTESILASTTTVSVDNGFKVVGNTPPVIPAICKIALNSEVEGFHIRTLNIYEKVDRVRGAKIASIKIYGEVEGEDERLKVLLTNMGMNLDTTDFYIFKSSNIQEGSPDFTILNEKRKELLLQASQIKPFVGTYKALLHAIDFFGYDKLTLKEYWLNINENTENFGKLKAIAVPNQDVVGFLADKNKGNDLPNSNQKKTSRFSLVYRINAPTGEVDEWDIPRVEETLDFSPDEVLIKLYGLKNKLQREYLPLQAKIVDITGEADYFSQFNQNVWNNQHGIKNQQAGVEFDFDLTPSGRNIFIEDLRKVDYRLTGLSQDFNDLNDRPEISESIKDFYSTYYNQPLDTFNTVDGIPIGAPIVLELTDINDTWDDAEFTWMDAGKEYAFYDSYSDFPSEITNVYSNIRAYLNANALYTQLTWNNWWHRSVYEVEWVLRGPRNYFKAFRGPIEDYKVFPLVLPFDGTYTVDANLYDLYNVKSTKTKKDLIEVKNKAVEVYGLTQFAGNKLDWNAYKYTWNASGSSWDWGRVNTSTVEDSIATYYLTLDRANYITDDTIGAEFSTVRRFLDSTKPSGFNETPGPYQWRELLPHVWNDGPAVTWDMTRVGGDINSSFKIRLNGYSNGYNLEITQLNPVNNQILSDSYEIQATYPANNQDLTAWQAVASELNNLDPIQHPILSRFNYNEILVDSTANGTGNNTGPQDEDICEYILAVGREPSRSYDFNTVSFDDIAGGEITDTINFNSYNPSFDDTYIINSQATLHLLNHLTFSYDLSNMPGVIAHKWRLINNTLNTDDIYYNNQWLTYLFKEKGDYTVELELTDSNGNKNKTTKNILKIV